MSLCPEGSRQAEIGFPTCFPQHKLLLFCAFARQGAHTADGKAGQLGSLLCRFLRAKAVPRGQQEGTACRNAQT